MRTTAIILTIFAFFLIVFLFAMAYNSDESTKQWKNKYFATKALVTEQSIKIEQLTNDKEELLKDLEKINKRVEETNKMLEDTSNTLKSLHSQVEANTKKLQDKERELENTKRISNLPLTCPPIPEAKPVKPKKKRIPYDVAPSQQ